MIKKLINFMKALGRFPYKHAKDWAEFDLRKSIQDLDYSKLNEEDIMLFENLEDWPQLALKINAKCVRKGEKIDQEWVTCIEKLINDELSGDSTLSRIKKKKIMTDRQQYLMEKNNLMKMTAVDKLSGKDAEMKPTEVCELTDYEKSIDIKMMANYGVKQIEFQSELCSHSVKTGSYKKVMLCKLHWLFALNNALSLKKDSKSEYCPLAEGWFEEQMHSRLAKWQKDLVREKVSKLY